MACRGVCVAATVSDGILPRQVGGARECGARVVTGDGEGKGRVKGGAAVEPDVLRDTLMVKLY